MRAPRLLALTLVALAAAFSADAQTGKVHRVGVLVTSSASVNQPQSQALRQGLRDLGYEEGRNVVIEYRWADGDLERLPRLAKELVALNPDVILTGGGPQPALAVKAATRTIPIVFLGGPAVEAGLVASLARPGGNLTGIDVHAADLDAKRLELLKEALPKASRVAVLWNPQQAGPARQERVEAAARTLGLQVRFVGAGQPSEIDTAFAAMARERPHALLVLANPMLSSQRSRILDLAARHRLPGMYQWREFAQGGGLMSYGANVVDLNRRAAAYIDKILKGARPADIPVELPTKYELVVNLKTAKALGLTVSPSILLQADTVIE